MCKRNDKGSNDRGAIFSALEGRIAGVRTMSLLKVSSQYCIFFDRHKNSKGKAILRFRPWNLTDDGIRSVWLS